MGCCISLFPDSENYFDLNSRLLKVKSLIGEGGFAYVYIVEDKAIGRQYALKKMLLHDQSSYEQALREIEVLKEFRGHQHIISLIDHAIIPINKHNRAQLLSPTLNGNSAGTVRANHDSSVSETSISFGSSTNSSTSDILQGDCCGLLLLPLYLKGSLQGLIETLAHEKRYLDEDVLIHYFLQICRAVKHLHVRSPPLAHYDIKPHNVLLDDTTVVSVEKQPSDETGTETQSLSNDVKYTVANTGELGMILTDFGSTTRARITLNSQADCVTLQEYADRMTSPQYRAPELFTPQPNTEIDERVDIWALGCTLYAMAFHEAPFEAITASGSSIKLATLNGKITFPTTVVGTTTQLVGGYSEELRTLIQSMLTVEPEMRPSIHDVIEQAELHLQQLHSTDGHYPDRSFRTSRKNKQQASK